jgi:hypothetical protein
MEPLGFEPALSPGDELPYRVAGFRVERVELAVVAAHVDAVAVHRRGCRHGSAGGPLPELPAGLGVDRINIAVVAAKVQHLVLPHRRGDHPIAGRKGPLDAVKLARGLAGVHARVRRIAAERRRR